PKPCAQGFALGIVAAARNERSDELFQIVAEIDAVRHTTLHGRTQHSSISNDDQPSENRALLFASAAIRSLARAPATACAEIAFLPLSLRSGAKARSRVSRRLFWRHKGMLRLLPSIRSSSQSSRTGRGPSPSPGR